MAKPKPAKEAVQMSARKPRSLELSDYVLVRDPDAKGKFMVVKVRAEAQLADAEIIGDSRDLAWARMALRTARSKHLSDLERSRILPVL